MAPFGNFFRALKLKTRLELADEEWVYTEEPHVERRRVRDCLINGFVLHTYLHII